MTLSGRAYFLVPIIYVGVILGLLFLQFSGGERFSRSVGPLTLQATRGATGDDGMPSVRDLNLTFDGLSFNFEEESGLIVETSNDVVDKRVSGYEVREDGFRLRFEDDYVLQFVISTDPARELQIRLELPPEPTGLREVSIPFQFAGAPVDPDVQRVSFTTLIVDEREYYFTAPPRGAIDLRNRRIVLQPEAAGQSVRYVQATDGDPARVAGWFRDEALAIEADEYERRVGAWIDAAWAGWADGRYNAARVAWRGPGGLTSFSEDALTAYLAEAWRRDEYERAYAEMRRAQDLHPDQLGLLSSTFLGNLDRARTTFLASDRLEAELIREQVAGRDPTVFRRPGVFGFAADRADEDLYRDLVSFASEIDEGRLDLVSAVGLLRNLHLDPLPDARAEALRAAASSLVETAVLSSVVRTDEGFFLQTSPGQIDLFLSVVAGAVLDAYGADGGDRAVAMAGRNLVASALARADRYGIIPSSLLVRGETVEAGGGQIVPEQLYPLLAGNPAYPRQVSLYRQAGSGSWVFTSAGLRPLRIDASEWRFELSYPRLRTHYLIVQGVPPFGRMELFGQTWRDAPDFEIYSKGRHYNAQTGTLMIKYYDDSVSREFALFF